MPEYPRIVPCGDAAVLVEFGDAIDAGLNEKVITLERAVDRERIPGVVECVPTYRSLLVHLDPLEADHSTLVPALRRLASEVGTGRRSRRHWQVPVVYGGGHGEDLDVLAAAHGLTPTEVIEMHSRSVYRVHMVGFMPGFTYLGGLDRRLATPRRPVPRRRIPGGSISIGGYQSAIGSIPSPSGWHLIGRTPVICFHPERDPAFLFEPGDEIMFDPIAEGDWERLAERAAGGGAVAIRTHG